MSGRNSAVECQLPKLDVTGSIPVARSKLFAHFFVEVFYLGQLSESLARPMLTLVLLDELSNQSGPTGLVTRADAGAVVAVEVFVKRD